MSVFRSPFGNKQETTIVQFGEGNVCLFTARNPSSPVENMLGFSNMTQEQADATIEPGKSTTDMMPGELVVMIFPSEDSVDKMIEKLLQIKDNLIGRHSKTQMK